jgi:sugar lactone lactonase YvrE
MVYVTISGPRGKQTPVSIVRVSPDGRGTPFVTGILNATGLAFNPEGDLFVTSRAEGNVYRIDSTGESTIYAEGMGVATGCAFDAEGNLFVGDRSGTIFKIDRQRRIFVYATLEPSPAAYHLAVNAEGVLFVTGPTLSSNDAIWAINTNGESHAWYRGLGRPQGLALANNGDVYVAACLHGRRGLVRVTTAGQASLVLAGTSLVGVAFSPLGTTILVTNLQTSTELNGAVFDVDLGVQGMTLF